MRMQTGTALFQRFQALSAYVHRPLRAVLGLGRGGHEGKLSPGQQKTTLSGAGLQAGPRSPAP